MKRTISGSWALFALAGLIPMGVAGCTGDDPFAKTPHALAPTGQEQDPPEAPDGDPATTDPAENCWARVDHCIAVCDPSAAPGCFEQCDALAEACGEPSEPPPYPEPTPLPDDPCAPLIEAVNQCLGADPGPEPGLPPPPDDGCIGPALDACMALLETIDPADPHGHEIVDQCFEDAVIGCHGPNPEPPPPGPPEDCVTQAIDACHEVATTGPDPFDDMALQACIEGALHGCEGEVPTELPPEDCVHIIHASGLVEVVCDGEEAGL